MDKKYLKIRNGILSGNMAFYVDGNSRHRFHDRLFRFIEATKTEEAFIEAVAELVITKNKW